MAPLPTWMLCPRRDPASGTCLGCGEEHDVVLLSVSVRENVVNDQDLVGYIACQLHELLGADNPFPTPWILHKAPRFALDTRDWAITARPLEHST